MTQIVFFLMVLVLCLLLLFGAYTFFILAESHNVSKTKSIHIDHFLDDAYSFHADIGTLVFYFMFLPLLLQLLLEVVLDPLWQQAMIEELFVLYKTDTWYLVFQLSGTQLNQLVRDFLNSMIAKLFTKSHLFLDFQFSIDKLVSGSSVVTYIILYVLSTTIRGNGWMNPIPTLCEPLYVH